MQFHPIDGYLLDGRPDKAAAIAAALQTRVTDERALPFYRALEAVGARAADEALLALRLVIARQAPGDDAVRRLRGLAALARARDATAVAAAFKKDGTLLSDLSEHKEHPAEVAAAARAAYLAVVS
ncbi:MAG: hypothetical protein NVS2B17_23800 [Candidatus Velthaea sp.]